MVRRANALSLLVLPAMAAVFSFAGPASAEDAGCKILYDAEVLQARTPSRVYSTMTGSSGDMSSETISTTDAIYMKVGNQWKKSSSSPQDEARETADKARSYSGCQHIGDETVNGESAGIYTEANQESGINGKVWISKKRGLPLKAELSMGARRFSIRYDYDNIRPPAGAQ
jgi:hypothetical protein